MEIKTIPSVTEIDKFNNLFNILLNNKINYVLTPNAYEKTRLIDFTSNMGFEQKFCSTYSIDEVNNISIEEECDTIVFYFLPSNLELIKNTLSSFNLSKTINNIVVYIIYYYNELENIYYSVKESIPDNHSTIKIFNWIEKQSVRVSDSYPEWKIIPYKYILSEMKVTSLKLENTLLALKSEGYLSIYPNNYFKASIFIKSIITRHLLNQYPIIKSILRYNRFENFDFCDFCSESSIFPIDLLQQINNLISKGIIISHNEQKAYLIKINNTSKNLKVHGFKSSLDKDKVVSDFKQKSDNYKRFLVSKILCSSENTDKESKHNNTFSSFEKKIVIIITQYLDTLEFSSGKTLLCDCLIGSKNSYLAKSRLNINPFYGKLFFLKKEKLTCLIKKMIMNGLLSEKCIEDFKYQVLVNDNPKDMSFIECDFDSKEILNYLTDIKIKNVHDVANLIPLMFWMQPLEREDLYYFKYINNKNINTIIEIINSLYPIIESFTEKSQNISVEQWYSNNINIKRSLTFESSFVSGCSLDYHSVIQNGRRKHTKLGKLVYRAKYKNDESSVLKLIKELKHFLNTNNTYLNFDLLIGIPTRNICNEKDFILEIVSNINSEMGKENLNNILIRQNRAKYQKDIISNNERIKNIEKTLYIDPEVNLSNKKILLLDDIYDSGSTIEQASKLLISKGDVDVKAITFTKTLK